ncbi:hypothetical protein P4O66_008527 [Electrophorus voltai]|uniref:Uncharacterized protein n=1 Tax=Electrophorus voltai TaxID=2609070 RepID=A0AAD8ZDP4_9TELE|nr:hypothetical protein P4O66_008527 [Electrophorus voltai]
MDTTSSRAKTRLSQTSARTRVERDRRPIGTTTRELEGGVNCAGGGGSRPGEGERARALHVLGGDKLRPVLEPLNEADSQCDVESSGITCSRGESKLLAFLPAGHRSRALTFRDSPAVSCCSSQRLALSATMGAPPGLSLCPPHSAHALSPLPAHQDYY